MQINRNVSIFILLGIGVLVFGVVYGVLSINSDDTDIAEQKSDSTPPNSSSVASLDISGASEYEVLATKDFSIKAVIGNLSDYELKELEDAPINKRREYRVVVFANLSEPEIKATINKVILDVTGSDRDLDEVSVLVYDDERDVQGAYTVAGATWAFGGRWGSTTPKIASSNSREGYSVSYDVKERSAENSPSEQNLTIYQDYWDTLNLPGNPLGYQNHPVVLDAANQWEIARITEVSKRHGLTVDQLLDIVIEVAVWKIN